MILQTIDHLKGSRILIPSPKDFLVRFWGHCSMEASQNLCAPHGFTDSVDRRIKNSDPPTSDFHRDFADVASAGEQIF